MYLLSARSGTTPTIYLIENFICVVGVAVLQHQQPRVAAQLPSHVVSGDPAILSQHAGAAGRVQERPALHVPRRGLPQLLPRSQSVRARHPQERSRHAGRGAERGPRTGTLLLRNIGTYLLRS